jgi:arylformamidase
VSQFDAVVTFSNGGGLRADGFRVDVPGPDVTEQDVAGLFIASLNLLMVGSVELRNLSVFAEPHKGTRGGPSDRPAPGSLPGRIVDLTHPIRDGLITFPGLPAPQIRPHHQMTRHGGTSVPAIGHPQHPRAEPPIWAGRNRPARLGLTVQIGR